MPTHTHECGQTWFEIEKGRMIGTGFLNLAENMVLGFDGTASEYYFSYETSPLNYDSVSWVCTTFCLLTQRTRSMYRTRGSGNADGRD